MIKSSTDKDLAFTMQRLGVILSLRQFTSFYRRSLFGLSTSLQHSTESRLQNIFLLTSLNVGDRTNSLTETRACYSGLHGRLNEVTENAAKMFTKPMTRS